ncbi:MAG TPA: hypothetical protein VJR89_30850 [Polyangiales bacterium]|nr:hypothetical protein [Polyangiales bacterium]
MLQSSPPSIASGSAPARFGRAFSARPVGSLLGLGVEYAMFASGLGLALGLFATRLPLRAVDRAFGLQLRERFVDLLARISPG